MSVLAALILASGCDGEPTTPATPASVRFVNVVWSAPDGIAFTTNNQLVAGSSLGYARATGSCSALEAGSTTFGIGVPNSSGTALNSSVLATLNGQAIANGGNYTVLAGGHVLHPSVILLDNSVSGTIGANQAAVRFVNLAALSQFPFTVLKGSATGGTTVQNNVGFRGATAFSTVASGPQEYSIIYNNDAVITGSAGTLNLQPGTVNTVVIVRNATTENFELVSVPSCS